METKVERLYDLVKEIEVFELVKGMITGKQPDFPEVQTVSGRE